MQPLSDVREYVVLDLDDPILSPDGGSISVLLHTAAGKLVRLVMSRDAAQRAAEVVLATRKP